MLGRDANWILKSDKEGGVLKETQEDYKLAPSAVLTDFSKMAFDKIKTDAALFDTYLEEFVDPWRMFARRSMYIALTPIVGTNLESLLSEDLSKVISNLDMRRELFAKWIALSLADKVTKNARIDILFDALHDLGATPFSLSAARVISRFGLCPDPNFVLQKNNEANKAASEALLDALFEIQGMTARPKGQEWCAFLK